jgi:hypothetical protein
MRKTLIVSGIISGLAAAMLAAASARAQEDTLQYYAKRLDAAKQHCGTDQVLWLNTKTGAIAKQGSADFGTTESGRYVCEHDVSQGRYGTMAEPTTATPGAPATPGSTQTAPAPATPPKDQAPATPPK